VSAAEAHKNKVLDSLFFMMDDNQEMWSICIEEKWENNLFMSKFQGEKIV
jgi:hypothetical protein